MANSLPTISAGPPAAKGITMRMGRSGYAAEAWPRDSSPNTNAAAPIIFFVNCITPPESIAIDFVVLLMRPARYRARFFWTSGETEAMLTRQTQVRQREKCSDRPRHTASRCFWLDAPPAHHAATPHARSTPKDCAALASPAWLATSAPTPA